MTELEAFDEDRPERALPLTGYATLGCISPAGEFGAVEIQRRANGMLRFFYWTPALSHIRRELDRLEELGYVTAREVASGRVRRTLKYRITDAGSKALRDWAEGTSFEPPVVKSPAILRLWLGRRAGRPDLVLKALDVHIEYIKSERRALAASIREAERVHAVELAGPSDAESDRCGANVTTIRGAWVLSVLRFSARDFDHQVRNLHTLRRELVSLAISERDDTCLPT